jgi:hypothetical protein
MQEENLMHVSTGEPTYWPSDKRKVPDLLDFGITKGIPACSIHAVAGLDLSSDHSPVLLTMHTKVTPQNRPPTLSSKTDWVTFQNYINENLTLKVPLKTDQDIEDYVHHLVQTIQQAAWHSTTNSHIHSNENNCAPALKQKILDKRWLRRRWQHTRSPQDKANLNKATNELKILLNSYKQQAIQTYLESLTPTEATDYSLWKANKRLQRPQTPIPPLRTPGGEWAKSDIQKFNKLADHFEHVFQPHTYDQTGNDKQDTPHTLGTHKLPATPIKKFTVAEVRVAINKLRATKAPGYKLITGEILKKLPEVGLSAITYIYNSILRTGYFPGQWKVSQIVTILKPGKPAENVKSCRPISPLPFLSKVFEKLFITRIRPILQSTQIIPDHQFGFRRKHTTIEQVHRTPT